MLGNYDVTSNTAAFAIARKAASVTPAASSKVYGTADPSLTGTLSGFLASDNVTATYRRAPGETVGTYTISATLSPASVLGNYTATFNTASFTILLPPPPSVTASATPNTLIWSPNKVLVPVTISGSAIGTGLTVTYAVKDEYSKIQPSGALTVGANGQYSFVVNLEAYRNGTDADGRYYTITVRATDAFGRSVSATTIVRVPHDQQ